MTRPSRQSVLWAVFTVVFAVGIAVLASRSISNRDSIAALRTDRAQLADDVAALHGQLEALGVVPVAPVPPSVDGADGVDGEEGEDGRDGRDGRDGAPGVPGVPGPSGPPGVPGGLGPIGPSGPSGPPGPAGVDGGPGPAGKSVGTFSFTQDGVTHICTDGDGDSVFQCTSNQPPPPAPIVP